MDLTALVHNDIRDLIPGFLRNRDLEVRALRQAIADEDAQRVEHLACRMYGAGNPFGFRQVTTFGKQLRQACAALDFDEAAEIVAQYEQYLSDVEIKYVDAPPKRDEWLPRTGERRQEAPAAEMAAVKPAIDRRVAERRNPQAPQRARSLRAG